MTWILKLKQCLQVIVVKIINLDNSAMVSTFSSQQKYSGFKSLRQNLFFAHYIGDHEGLLQFCTKTNLQKHSSWDNWRFEIGGGCG